MTSFPTIIGRELISYINSIAYRFKKLNRGNNRKYINRKTKKY